MNRTFSSITRFILPLALAAAAPAYAQSAGGGSMSSCSGGMTSSSFLGMVNIDCGGNLTASGQDLTAAVDLGINAGGSLKFTNQTLAAPLLTLTSNDALTVNGNSSVNGLNWNIVNGNITSSAKEAPTIVNSGSALFTGLPGQTLATASKVSWELFTAPGAKGTGNLFDLPSGMITAQSLVSLVPQLADGRGTAFLDVAGQGGLLVTAAPVPEPGTGTLAVAGLLGLLMIARRRGRV